MPKREQSSAIQDSLDFPDGIYKFVKVEFRKGKNLCEFKDFYVPASFKTTKQKRLVPKGRSFQIEEIEFVSKEVLDEAIRGEEQSSSLSPPLRTVPVQQSAPIVQQQQSASVQQTIPVQRTILAPPSVPAQQQSAPVQQQQQRSVAYNEQEPTVVERKNEFRYRVIPEKHEAQFKEGQMTYHIRSLVAEVPCMNFLIGKRILFVIKLELRFHESICKDRRNKNGLFVKIGYTRKVCQSSEELVHSICSFCANLKNVYNVGIKSLEIVLLCKYSDGLNKQFKECTEEYEERIFGKTRTHTNTGVIEKKVSMNLREGNDEDIYKDMVLFCKENRLANLRIGKSYCEDYL